VRAILAAILALAMLIPGAGCMRTARARDTTYSGFLANYAHLERATNDTDAVYQWRKPGVQWADYDKLVLDPVTIFGDAHVQSALSRVERRNLLEYFYNTLYVALAPEFLMIDDPEPGAVRLEVAVTGIGARKPILDTASNLSPVAMATTEVVWAATGKAPFTGELAIEFRITDAATGETLSEGADRRVGGRWLVKGFDKWADAYAAIDAYAENFSDRLGALRGGACGQPLRP
jgi:hypothetical protein